MKRQRLALGTVQFGLRYGVANQGGQVSFDEIKQILVAAKGYGLDTLDTAIAYGNSEQVLGKCGIAEWQIVTKLPPVPASCPNVIAWVDDQVSRSLARLGVSSVHGVLLHQPEQLLGDQGPELLRALLRIQHNGWTKCIGVSVYAPDELERLFALHSFDLVQAPLSILDRRLVDSGWASRLKQLGVELHTRSAFLQGLLLMTAAQRPAKFSRWQPIWDSWDTWLAANGISPLEACLGYALSVSDIDRVVVGVDGLVHFEEIMLASDGGLFDLPDWPTIPDVQLINPAMWNLL